jgi:hypothetical protein
VGGASKKDLTGKYNAELPMHPSLSEPVGPCTVMASAYLLDSGVARYIVRSEGRKEGEK